MKMNKKMILSLVLAALFIQPTTAFAKSDYIYRNRINWVKLDELSKKQLAGVELLHPSSTISEAQMHAMLLSIQMNKGAAFKNDIKTTDVFDEDEATKYAALIVQALAQAAPNEVVSVSVVNKRAAMVVRNDHLTMLNVFVTAEGVHFYFGKLFAKLDGDYMEVSKMDQTIRNAKSMRVALTAASGQRLSFGVEDELILDPNFDFVNNVAKTQMPADTKSPQKTVAKTTTPTSATAPAVETAPTETIEERLQNLENLKQKGLISDKEYKAKKKEVLDEI